jgi:UDP:flavonoid glycosyltransferase YjiC (YdhE family)
LHPLLALALELRRRGHGAEIATVTGYREKIEALGLRFHALRPELSLADEELVRRIVDGLRGPQYLLRDILLANVRATHDDLSVAARGADLLITSELVYAAPIVAEILPIRRVSYALAPLSYFSSEDPPTPPLGFVGPILRSMPIVLRALKSTARWLTRSWWQPVRELRNELGLPAGKNPIFGDKYAPLLDLALFSGALQPPQRDWPPQTVQTGFCFFDEVDANANPALPGAVENFLAAGEPPIVFTLGSSAVYAAGEFYAESARAAEMIGRRALLLIGKNPPPPNLPPSILAWDYLAYAAIFPRGAAVVHSGGVGTTAQALRAGRPMLIMPFAFDQFDNAARIARMGAGRTISRGRYRAARAARELGALLGEKRFAETAARLGARIRSERGVENAADAIERVLTG